MGGFLALTIAARYPDAVTGVAALSAVNMGELGARSKTPEQRKFVWALAETSAPITGSNPDMMIAAIQAHESEWNYLSYVPRLKTLPVLVVETQDPFTAENVALANSLRRAGDSRVTERALDSDHDFFSRRIALERTVLTWLLSL